MQKPYNEVKDALMMKVFGLKNEAKDTGDYHTSDMFEAMASGFFMGLKAIGTDWNEVIEVPDEWCNLFDDCDYEYKQYLKLKSKYEK